MMNQIFQQCVTSCSISLKRKFCCKYCCVVASSSLWASDSRVCTKHTRGTFILSLLKSFMKSLQHDLLLSSYSGRKIWFFITTQYKYKTLYCSLGETCLWLQCWHIWLLIYQKSLNGRDQATTRYKVHIDEKITSKAHYPHAHDLYKNSIKKGQRTMTLLHSLHRLEKHISDFNWGGHGWIFKTIQSAVGDSSASTRW